ncbi:hypothetical protein A4A49_01760 [Nicotiana attenuata]|uniref:Uncharacterized protein n=1 Tax=Nicotiana attenuata TaxID=49451 RepID=A0A1J6IAI6_NICAT|nr:hypothetical protein A4A49_01760 [Nicotiana attenuata]
MMVLERFSGNDNPERWLFRVEQYFTYLGFAEKDWLPLPCFYLDGEALNWFNWLFRNNQFFDWKYFKAKFAQHFRQLPTTHPVGSLAYSSQVRFNYINYIPIVSQSVLVYPFPAPSQFSSAFESADETGNSKADHVFDELPKKYESVDSFLLITVSNTIVQPIEDMEVPQVRYAKSVEIADMVHEPSTIIEEQVFNKNSRTTLAKLSNDSFCEDVSLQTTVPTEVLDDTRGSNIKEEENSRHNVALFKNSPQKDLSGFLIPFASRARIVEIAYPFDGALWPRTISCLLNSLEGIREYIIFDPGPYLEYVTPYAVGSTFEDGKYVEEGAVKIRIELPAQKLPIGQGHDDLGESTENSLMWHFGGVTAHIVEQLNAPVLQSAICAYMNCNILAFSLESITLLDQISRSRKISVTALPHSTPIVKSEEEDSCIFIGKNVIICLHGILEYYGVTIVKDLTLVQVTSFMALRVDIYTNLEAMVRAQIVCYDLPRINPISLKFLIFDFDPKAQEEDATRLFHQLMIVGVFLTNSIIDVKASACSLLSGSKLEKLLYGYSINTQITYDVRIGNIICSIPFKSGIPDCVDEASKRAARIRDMPATVYELFFYLKLGEYSCIFNLQFVINLQISCSRRVSKSTCLYVVLQELKIKALALTLQYSGNFSNSRDSKILVIYWKLIWLLILGRLTNSKDP